MAPIPLGSALTALWKASREGLVHCKFKLLRGDLVQIIDNKHKDFGAQGVITRVVRDQKLPPTAPRSVWLAGLNMKTKFSKRTKEKKGSQIKAPLESFKVAIVDPETKKPARVGIRFTETGDRVRVATGPGSSGAVLPRSPVLLQRKSSRSLLVGPKDTHPESVRRVTATPETMLPPASYFEDVVEGVEAYREDRRADLEVIMERLRSEDVAKYVKRQAAARAVVNAEKWGAEAPARAAAELEAAEQAALAEARAAADTKRPRSRRWLRGKGKGNKSLRPRTDLEAAAAEGAAEAAASGVADAGGAPGPGEGQRDRELK